MVPADTWGVPRKVREDATSMKEVEVKKILIVSATALAVLFALRRFGPAIRDWAEAKCEQMMARGRVAEQAASASRVEEPNAAVPSGQR
jgi:hypothetical protein